MSNCLELVTEIPAKDGTMTEIPSLQCRSHLAFFNNSAGSMNQLLIISSWQPLNIVLRKEIPPPWLNRMFKKLFISE